MRWILATTIGMLLSLGGISMIHAAQEAQDEAIAPQAAADAVPQTDPESTPTQTPGEGAAAATPPAGPSLKVVVTDENGRSVDTVQLTLWRAVKPGEATPRAGCDPWEAGYWVDPASKMTWESGANAQAGSEYTIDEGLKAGYYRVTASSVSKSDRGDCTPSGVSDPIYVDGTAKETSVTVRLEGGVPFTLRVTDAGTGSPIGYAKTMLVRADGLPIGFGSGGWVSWTDDKGSIRYHALPPGAYTVRAASHARQYGDKEYAEVERSIHVAKAPSGETINVPLSTVSLTQDEIAERWPFVVEGAVSDADGRPVKGVELRVSCGMGTLLPTGSAITGENGKYTLRFSGGYTSVDKASGKQRIPLQVATVYAFKSGFCERNLCRQGNLGITSDAGEAAAGSPYFSTVLAPGKPYSLDFVMTPAASLKARVVDAAGKPVSGRQLWLTGKELYPSTSVLSNCSTDADGRFTVKDVPLKTYWFVIRTDGGKEIRTSAEISFTKAGQYEVELTFDAAKETLTARTTSP